MSKSLYEEAIAEAKLLRDTAEKNAKNAIIEAVTPKIREFIEEQLIGESSDDGSNEDVLQDVASEIVGSDLSESNSEVILDDSAMSALLNLFGADDFKSVSDKDVVRDAIKESISELDGDSREKLLKMADKLSESDDLFDSQRISSHMDDNPNNDLSSKNDDNLYEIDLSELETLKSGDNMDAIDKAEAQEIKEIMSMLGLNSLDEARLEIDLGDLEIPEDLMPTIRVVEEEEEESEEDLEAAEAPEEEEEVDIELEDFEGLDEVFEIDEKILRSELVRLRQHLSEAKDLTKIKGIKSDMQDSWGGKGSGKSGVKNSYGGSGGKMPRGADFGGGKPGKDPLQVKLNVLSEQLRNERRNNRSLSVRLKEYRGAVETLREQLTDLNLFNAKLLYVNKLLQSKEITPAQRKSVVESIDNARSLREVKLLYRSLTESFDKGKSGSMNESSVRRAIGSSSKVTGRSSANSADDQVNRWATLAGIK
jgi:hypothetical protein